MVAKTTAERQSTRRRRLNEAAQAMGYPTWGKYETAVLNGDAKMNQAPFYVKVSDDGFMQAVVYNTENIRLVLATGTEIPQSEWTQAEREFIQDARREALQEMAG